MAIALVQKAKNSSASGSNSLAVTLPGATTAGNLLVAFLLSDNSDTDTFTPPVGWTLGKRQGFTADGDTCAIYYSENCAGGSTSLTFTRSTTGFAFIVVVAEYSGIATSTSLDQTNGATGNNITATAGSITTTQADEVIFMGAVNALTSTVTGQAASFTLEDSTQSGGVTVAWIDRIVAATGTYSPSITFSNGANFNGIQASFKAATGGGTTTNTLTVSDAGTLGDSLVAWLDTQTARADAATPGDATTTLAGSGSLSATETLSTDDGAVTRLAAPSLATDTGSTLDSLTGWAAAPTPYAEAPTLLDTLVQAGSSALSSSDALSSGDSQVPLRLSTASDAPTVAETSVLAGKASDSFSDPLSSSDNVVFPGGTVTNPISVSDSLAVGDGLGTGTTGTSGSDTAALTESLGTGVGSSSLSDAPTVGESLVQAGSSALSFTDAATVSDLATVLRALLPPADALSVAESAVYALQGSANFQDLLVAAEALVANYTYSATEPASTSSDAVILQAVALTGAPVAAPSVILATSLLRTLVVSVQGGTMPFRAMVALPLISAVLATGAAPATIAVPRTACVISQGLPPGPTPSP